MDVVFEGVRAFVYVLAGATAFWWGSRWGRGWEREHQAWLQDKRWERARRIREAQEQGQEPQE